MIPGMVYNIWYDCRPRGCDELGQLLAYWTGEVDWIGKKTFKPVQGRSYGTFYLFDDEIERFEPIVTE